MRVLLQRVQHASVCVSGAITGSIQQGSPLLVGITLSDIEDIMRKMVGKCTQFRVFEDENGKMGRRLQDIGGSILSISQFTLYADCKWGRRPGFEKATYGDFAQSIYHAFNEELRIYGIHVEMGISGADTKVNLLNDGSATILLDSEEWQKEVEWAQSYMEVKQRRICVPR